MNKLVKRFLRLLKNNESYRRLAVVGVVVGFPALYVWLPNVLLWGIVFLAIFVVVKGVDDAVKFLLDRSNFDDEG